jgi:hypothetical protein
MLFASFRHLPEAIANPAVLSTNRIFRRWPLAAKRSLMFTARAPSSNHDVRTQGPPRTNSAAAFSWLIIK